MRIGIHKSFLFVAIAIALLSFWGQPVQAAKKMPVFSLVEAISGKMVNSNTFSGKALFVTFFATWCPPCMQEIPTLIKLQEKYADDGFSVVGLSVDQEGAKIVSRLVKRRSINYPVLMADSKTARSFGGVYGIPVSFLVNKKGNVVKKYTGYVPQSILVKDLKKVLF